MLVRHLPAGLVDICLSKPQLLTTKPDAGMCLTWNGLEAAYEGPAKCGMVSVAVPYRELRPLVRPGTPLARMLAARGLVELPTLPGHTKVDLIRNRDDN